jgi:hypothetical protein
MSHAKSHWLTLHRLVALSASALLIGVGLLLVGQSAASSARRPPPRPFHLGGEDLNDLRVLFGELEPFAPEAGQLGVKLFVLLLILSRVQQAVNSQFLGVDFAIWADNFWDSAKAARASGVGIVGLYLS